MRFNYLPYLVGTGRSTRAYIFNIFKVLYLPYLHYAFTTSYSVDEKGEEEGGVEPESHGYLISIGYANQAACAACAA